MHTSQYLCETDEPDIQCNRYTDSYCVLEPVKLYYMQIFKYLGSFYLILHVEKSEKTPLSGLLSKLEK